MPLITLADAGLAYGLTPLLDRANLTVQPNERIGLIGRNGTGKSSLLKIIFYSTVPQPLRSAPSAYVTRRQTRLAAPPP